MEIEELQAGSPEQPEYIPPEEPKEFIHGWKYIILAIGYFQMLNLLFWIVQLLVHKKGEMFFGGDTFNKVAYYFGWFSIGLSLVYFLGVVAIAFMG